MRTSDRESFFKQVIFSLSYLLRDPFLKQYFEICFFAARVTPCNIHEEQIYSLRTISIFGLGGGLSLLQGEHLPNCRGNLTRGSKVTPWHTNTHTRIPTHTQT